MRRRLTVILASDVAEYSRLVAAAEEETIHRLGQASDVFSGLTAKYHGRVFKTAGDAILAEFQSAVDATRCAIDFQDANNAENAAIPGDKRLLFRIGIAIGDVLVAEDGDLLGDAVNIAARLEGLASPGGICISDHVRGHVAGKIAIDFVDLGETSLKNIPHTVRAFRLIPGPGRGSPPVASPTPAKAAKLIRLAAGTLLTAAIASAFLWYRRLPVEPSISAPTQPFDAASIPLVPDAAREMLSGYDQRPDWKAIAIARQGSGSVWGAPDLETAKLQALDRCRRQDERGYCRLYAVGNTVVWPKSMLPLPADLRSEPLADAPVVAADLASLPSVPPPLLSLYLDGADHRALATGGAGSWYTIRNASRPEAIRLAVERCSDLYALPCLLISVDGFPTVRIPKLHRLAQIFTLAGEHGMTDAEKLRIAQVYGGAEWRALAKGSSGRWYAVNAMESEAVAGEKAVEACRAAERECTLYAVGNFRLADK